MARKSKSGLGFQTRTSILLGSPSEMFPYFDNLKLIPDISNYDFI